MLVNMRNNLYIGNKKSMFYIYHIKGVKIGCTKTLKRRMRDQGFTDYEILEVHTDIDVASLREKELQKDYGYNEIYTKINYKQSVNNLSKSRQGFIKGSTPWNKGKSHSDETKQKLSLSLKGRKQSEEEKEKRRLSVITSNTTEEYKKAQSERIKEWWRLRKLKIE
jgi:hypothetical protein